MVLSAARMFFLTPLLELYARERYGQCTVRVTSERGAAAMDALWTSLLHRQGTEVLAAVELSAAEVAAIALHGSQVFGEGQGGLKELPADAPTPGFVLRGLPASIRTTNTSPEFSAALAKATQEQRDWVDRALAPGPLRFCPYTASSHLAGVGLEAQGVRGAPIAYHISSAQRAPELMADFWRATTQMLKGGEETTSSIILSAPAWDRRWEEWRDHIFPLLEDGVIAAGLGRTIGIVCFHPNYEVPSAAHLAKHRFGHMHSVATLRRWLGEHQPALEDHLSDHSLGEAAAQMRRSPNAVINVLWSRQLEVAEEKRRSSLLYSNNIARTFEAGEATIVRS